VEIAPSVQGGYTAREYTATTASVYYLVGDHLGSTSVVTSSNGSQYSRLLYTAWGELRYTTGDTAIRYRFTGQREEAILGLYDYGARFYDPRLGRFVQADTIVPDPGKPITYDRYAYARNNPVIYNDPSGHDVGCSEADPKCLDQNAKTANAQAQIKAALKNDKDRRNQESAVYLSDKNGICVNVGNIGCSGGPAYWEFQGRTNIPSLAYEFESRGIAIADAIDAGLLTYDVVEGATGMADPKIGLPIDGLVQAWQDLPNRNLTMGQRVGRASVATVEGFITTFASTATGISSGAASASLTAGLTVNPIAISAAGVSGYALGYISANRAGTNAWSQFNHDLFPNLGLGNY
jgi:RHS repeat-associated protein